MPDKTSPRLAKGHCFFCAKHHLCSEHVQLLASLPEATQDKLRSTAIHKTLERDERLFHRGEAMEVLYIVVSGKIKLHSYDKQGNELIHNILLDGETIGEELFLEHGHYPYEATALEKTNICGIKDKDFKQALDQEPQLRMQLTLELNRKLKDANTLNLILLENDAAKRVAAFLLWRGQKLQGDQIELGLDEIASSINLRRETVSRKLSELREAGLIERHGKRKIQITDWEGLKAFSQ